MSVHVLTHNLSLFSGERMAAYLEHMKALDDVMKQNRIYTALRSFVGDPDPPRLEALQFKVRTELQ